MMFPYTEVEEYVCFKTFKRILPWIPISIFNPNNPKFTITPLGLADSGSDITIVDYEIGVCLGYNLKKGRQDIIRGVGGGKLEGYFHEAGFMINDPRKKEKLITYVDDVFFAEKPFPDTVPQQTAIYGTQGFFKHTIVTFDFPSSINIQG